MMNEARRFFGFVFAGGSATVLNYAIFASLYALGVNYLVASATGYVSGIAMSYSINRFVIFKDAERRRGQLTRYVLIYLIALIGQVSLLEGGVRLGVDPLISNAIALVIVVIVNFFVMRRFVFDVGHS